VFSGRGRFIWACKTSINLILEKPEIDAIIPGKYLRAQSTDCPALDAGCHELFSATHCSKNLGGWCRDEPERASLTPQRPSQCSLWWHSGT